MESGQWTEDIKKALENNDRALAVKRIQEYLDKENNTPINIAVTGESGSGKSTFVNAFRGINNEDERAAPTGCVETTIEVTPYPHPNYPNVTLWDIPGIGRFPADKYLKFVGFERFDFFIIISADRFRENDVKLAQEIQRMKKKFYFVRSKIDCDIRDEKRCQRSKFNAERTLKPIRDKCIQSLQRQGVESPQVFLVSCCDLHLYDFPLLVNTFVSTFRLQFSRIIMEDSSHLKSTEDIKIARESSNWALAVKMIQEYLDRKKNIPLNIGSTGESGCAKSTFVNAKTKTLESNNQVLAEEVIQEYLDKENDISLNIAVTGESGSGKSTFVNAFRGINNGDERAAPTGPVETTSEATPYPHPNYPNVTLWDLPGIGTPKFPADNYLKLVGFERFDIFIIISATRFRENDEKLAQEIQRMGRKFYFVRSKIDTDIRDEERRQRSKFNAERCLEQIKENCTQGLQREGVESPQVFLVSSFHRHLYDFPLLGDTFERELSAHKKHALLLAMSNISLEVIDKKKKAYQSKIKYYALLSAGGAAVPVPGISVAVDVDVLVSVVTQYVNGFGLDVLSLQRLADSTHVPYDELTAIIVSPLAAVKITPDLVLKVLSQCADPAVLRTSEEGFRFTPVFGIPAAMSLSFICTYRALNTLLDMLAEDAQRVFKKAWVWTPQCDFVR
ncbi:interferon-inducible GTPase 5-like [Epinephelus moara]|uniref:interferon-inducible GTPase 5-like n=1 Tax=Epinephelus moara TaxID=300413 RepID=UPI00214F487C|nr:interferon-inducible GTPase 5-like [Epinephelus moara]